jgi:hypothetical protein
MLFSKHFFLSKRQQHTKVNFIKTDTKESPYHFCLRLQLERRESMDVGEQSKRKAMITPAAAGLKIIFLD